MANKLQHDKGLKRELISFFMAVETAQCRTPEEASRALGEALTGRRANRMVDGIMFDVTPELQQAQLAIVRRCVRLLGSKLGHEDEVTKSLWRIAVDHVVGPKLGPEKRAHQFLSTILDGPSEPRQFLAPNRLFSFDDAVEELVVGPVSILTGERAAAEVSKRGENPNWKVELGHHDVTYDLGGMTTLYFTPVCWLVHVAAARGNVEEEAVWSIGVAVSLLRLAVGRTLGQICPRLGETEPHPVHSKSDRRTGIILEGSTLSAGGWARARTYTVAAATVEACSSEEFQVIAQGIFEAPPKSVGERVARGLGWLTRARQTDDRAERFLFFFTAIEALFSNDDKTAPVVQTIARHAATMISDKPEDRAATAALVRRLYEARSALVHAGSRAVSRTDAATIQNIAEDLFWVVLAKVELGQSVETFQQTLSHCSYGLPWCQDTPSRLPPIPEDEAA